MTLDKLQNIVVRLANQGWVRYWVNYFGESDKQPTMALHLRFDGDTVVSHGLTDELVAIGFLPMSHGIYGIKRTNEDGTPWISRLP